MTYPAPRDWSQAGITPINPMVSRPAWLPVDAINPATWLQCPSNHVQCWTCSRAINRNEMMAVYTWQLTRGQANQLIAHGQVGDQQVAYQCRECEDLAEQMARIEGPADPDEHADPELHERARQAMHALP
jgi:hypothetical protein